MTLKPLEDKLKDKFGISRVVVCTDCGLSSYENRKNDHIGDRSFITVQSLKKLKKHIQDWALDPSGWRMRGEAGKQGERTKAKMMCVDLLRKSVVLTRVNWHK